MVHSALRLNHPSDSLSIRGGGPTIKNRQRERQEKRDRDGDREPERDRKRGPKRDRKRQRAEGEEKATDWDERERVRKSEKE